MQFHRVIASGLLLTLFTQLGCGTILYPERRGRTSGQIDPAVAIMDGLACLLFLIPGIVAFAVDFGTGAIYLPGGRRGEVEVIPFEGDDLESALDAVERRRGIALGPHLGELRVFRLEDADAARAHVAALGAGGSFGAGSSLASR